MNISLKFKSILVLATCALISCNSEPKSPNTRVGQGGVALGGSLAVNVEKQPSIINTDPKWVSTPAQAQLAAQVHLGLMRFDPISLKPMPALAEGVEVNEDGTLYLFTIRKGVLFHDDACFDQARGREVTARDVAFSLTRLCEPDSGTAYASTLKGRVDGADAFHAGETIGVAGIEVLDDYTVSIRLTKPDQAFLHVLASPATAIVPHEAVKKYGEGGRVGAGPFRFANADKNLLVRNPNYFAADAFGNNLPYIDTLRFLSIADKRTEVEALLAGGLDIVTNVNATELKDVLEASIALFSGKDPKFVMERTDDAADTEIFTLYRQGVKGFKENFFRLRDYSVVQRVR